MAKIQVDERPPYKKLTNIAATIGIIAEVVAVAKPEYALIAHGIAAAAAMLLGVGVARRVARYGEGPKA